MFTRCSFTLSIVPAWGIWLCLFAIQRGVVGPESKMNALRDFTELTYSVYQVNAAGEDGLAPAESRLPFNHPDPLTRKRKAEETLSATPHSVDKDDADRSSKAAKDPMEIDDTASTNRPENVATAKASEVTSAKTGKTKEDPGSTLGDEVRVIREDGVADKKGQRHQIMRARTVSTSFGQACVDGYLGMVRLTLSRKIDALVSTPSLSKPSAEGDAETAVLRPPHAPQSPGNEDTNMATEQNIAGVSKTGGDQQAVTEQVVGIISYSEELKKNAIRSGVPPPLPKYARVAI